MKCFVRVTVAITAIALLVGVCFGDVTYTGSLVAGPSDGGGIWVNDPGNDPDWFPANIEWTVSENEDGSWNYAYFIQVYAGEVSHFILETSEPLPEGHIFDPSGQFGELVIGEWFYPGGGNPDMPGPVYGVKFDETWGIEFTVEFDSWRVPVWGDFYATDGAAGGLGINQFWNSGFLLPDPTAPPWDTSIDDHILRPDSYIPEPGTMTLMGLGLLGLVARVRRRNRNVQISASEESK